MDNKQAIQILAGRYQQIQEKEQAVERALVENYLTRLPVLANKYARAKPAKSAPLTIPAIFNRSYDENFISDYLAYVLNPQKNGIGLGPLKALLKLCAIDEADIPLDDAIIRREYPLEKGRLDLLIRFGESLVVGIENKIFSSEGTNQTPYYALVMDDLFADIPHHMIFLTRTGHRARSTKFIPASYAMLLMALKEVSVDHVQDHRKLFLWEDFLEHLEVYIMTANPNHFEFSEKSKLYIENHPMIHDLTTTFDREWDQAITYLETHFREGLTGGPWNTVFQTRYSWQQVYKPRWATGNPNIHFEWWLPLSAFLQGEMAFMVDVEGKRMAETLTVFASRYPSIESQYKQKGIQYCPQNRKNAIAFKKYRISQDINQIADIFLESFDEFRFLEAEIDTVLAIMSES
jgi:PD-(D/E)XK nuclease superfamily protein